MESFGKPSSLRSPNHPNSQAISPPLTRTTEVPDKRSESPKLGRKSCRRHRSFSRRSGRREGLIRISWRLQLPWPGKGSEPQLPRAARAPESLQLRLQATGERREQRSGPEKEAPHPPQPRTHLWPHPRGTFAAVILPGTASSLDVRGYFSLGPQTPHKGRSTARSKETMGSRLYLPSWARVARPQSALTSK